MYLINTHIETKNARYPEDFPMLTNGRTFAMKKHGEDFIIQTTLNDTKKIKKLVEAGESQLNKRIAQGKLQAERLLDQDNYTFDNLSKAEKREEELRMFYKEDYNILKANHAI